MDNGMDRGTRVTVRPHHSKPGKGLDYKAFHGELLEYCNGEGWDVVEVLTRDKLTVKSVYSFSVERGTP